MPPAAAPFPLMPGSTSRPDTSRPLLRGPQVPFHCGHPYNRTSAGSRHSPAQAGCRPHKFLPMRAEPDTLRSPSRRVLLPRPEMARYAEYVRFLFPGCPKYPDTISDTTLWYPEAASLFPPSADRLRYSQAVLGAGSLTERNRDNCPAAYEYRLHKASSTPDLSRKSCWSPPHPYGSPLHTAPHMDPQSQNNESHANKTTDAVSVSFRRRYNDPAAADRCRPPIRNPAYHLLPAPLHGVP